MTQKKTDPTETEPKQTEDKPLLSDEMISAIQDVVSGALLEFQPVLEDYVNTTVKTELEQRNEREQEATKDLIEPETENKPMTSEAQRIKALEEKLAEQERSATEADFDRAIGQALDGFNPMYREQALALFRQSNRDSFEKGQAGWLSKDGKTLDEQAKAFFETPFGKHLLPPVTNTVGTGTEPPKGTTPKPTQQDLGTQLAQVML